MDTTILFFSPENQVLILIISKKSPLKIRFFLQNLYWRNYGLFFRNPTVGIIIAAAEIPFQTAYIFSRTRYYRIGIFIMLITLAIIPILNISIGTTDYSSANLLLLLIWNVLTIFLSSMIASIRTTIFFTIFNIATLFLLPICLPVLPLKNMVLPLIFNGIFSLAILVFSHHRNQMEKEKFVEINQINSRLQTELTQRIQAEQKLAYSAFHDPLTDLPNRMLFMDRLNQAMERAKRHQEYKYAVIYLDLDRFKNINDSLGHQIGDQLLIESSKRLKSCLRSQDTIARLGGDEFVILLDVVQDASDAVRVSERIQAAMDAPFNLQGNTIVVLVSIGIVLSDPQYTQAEDVVRDADIAMYKAKGQGTGRFEIFEPSMLNRVMTRLEMETDLRKAIKNQEFLIQYQPIFNIQSKRILGFEALIRWQHPRKGLIPPMEFIPTAEETGLIVPIGYWVIEEACRQTQQWQEKFPFDPPLTISVNLSTRQCTQPNLRDKIEAILNKTKIKKGSLQLELTESLFMEDSEALSKLLTELRNLDIQVQIDDFGTGYSSLSYLQNLTVDSLKIDRSFVNRLNVVENNTEIVKAIMVLAHNLGLKVIAEGVETDEQLFNLQSLGCEFMQGFLFSKPINGGEIEKLLLNTNIKE